MYALSFLSEYVYAFDGASPCVIFNETEKKTKLFVGRSIEYALAHSLSNGTQAVISALDTWQFFQRINATQEMINEWKQRVDFPNGLKKTLGEYEVEIKVHLQKLLEEKHHNGHETQELHHYLLKIYTDVIDDFNYLRKLLSTPLKELSVTDELEKIKAMQQRHKEYNQEIRKYYLGKQDLPQEERPPQFVTPIIRN